MNESLRSRRNELTLASCALVFLAAYTYEVIWRPSRGALTAVEVVIWATWAVEQEDWAIAFYRDRDKRAHIWEHLLGFLVVVLPALEPLRALRLLSLMVFLQRMLVRSSIRVTVFWYAIASSGLLVYVSALAVLQVERDADGSTIHDIGTALWWAIATVTTVGYGDLTPVTGTGRLVAGALMVGGVALLGIVTATLASWLVERIAEETERVEAREEASLESVHAELAALRSEITALRTELGVGESARDRDVWRNRQM